MQQPNPPIWVAARDPNSHDFAVTSGCNVQVTPLASGDAEVTSLMERFNAACKAHPAIARPQIMLLMHTFVAEDATDAERLTRDLSQFYCQFGAWFQNKKPVEQGILEPLTEEEIAAMPQYAPDKIRQNLVIGEPEEVIGRLMAYEELGYDQYSIWIDSGLPHERKRKSLKLFIDKIMPAFRKESSR